MRTPSLFAIRFGPASCRIGGVQGLEELCRKQIVDAYLSGQIDRRKAVAELGAELVEELDHARESIESDIEWGLKST